MNEDVLLAVLAMDTYMRDWRKLANNLTNGLGDQIGNATVGKDSRILVAGSDGGRSDQANQFFAQAYSDSTYGTIVSYRGIGSPGEFTNATGIAYGNISVRVEMAAQFYQKIAADLPGSPTPFAANVTFTGHSMGGALAGIISSVYRQQAIVFDNTGFENALN
jgi:hypothetical protein